VTPYIDNFTKIDLDQNKIDKIIASFESHYNAKITESQYKSDGRQMYKRFATGKLCELACEQCLDIPIIDWTVGNSKKYNVADITLSDSRFSSGYFKCGIKGVAASHIHGESKFPIIFKKSTYPQIICIVNKNQDRVLICGVASPHVLNTYQNDYLVKTKECRNRGYKTGFYGFEKLKKFNGIDDLKNICLDFEQNNRA
jgi:hypothetical protein